MTTMQRSSKLPALGTRRRRTDEHLAFPRQGRRLHRLGMVAEHATLVLVALAAVLPLYMMLTASLQVRGEFDGTSFAPPTDITLTN
jgi:hypothetical protein